MRIATRRIRDALAAGRGAFGPTVQIASPEIVELVGWTGYDWVWIDAEHGTMGIETIGAMIRAADAAGIDSIVRVPDASATFIHRVLDAGATGVLVPHVRTREDAEAIVAATKYPPRGTRAVCPGSRSAARGTEPWASGYRRADDDTIAWALIEDVEGVANIEQIVAVPGLDGVLFGPFDLSQQMGLEGDTQHPEVKAMQQTVVRAARAAGVEVIAMPWDLQTGAPPRIVAVTLDIGLLADGFRQALADTSAQLTTTGDPA